MTLYDQICASAGIDQMEKINADSNCEDSGRLGCKASSSRSEERRNNLSLRELSRHLKEGEIAHSWMVSKISWKNKKGENRMPYLEIKSIIERRLAHQKRGILTTEEVTEAANEWRDYREERELDQGVIEREVRRFNKKMMHYDNNPIGSMTDKKECGSYGPNART